MGVSGAGMVMLWVLLHVLWVEGKGDILQDVFAVVCAECQESAVDVRVSVKAANVWCCCVECGACINVVNDCCVVCSSGVACLVVCGA